MDDNKEVIKTNDTSRFYALIEKMLNERISFLLINMPNDTNGRLQRTEEIGYIRKQINQLFLDNA